MTVHKDHTGNLRALEDQTDGAGGNQIEAPAGREKISPLRWLTLLFSGVLIGGGAILPGISGGVLCVVFGIYRPMMELMSHPVKAVPKYLRLFIPVGVGAALGFLFFARLIDVVFSANETLATWLFIGLIAGSFPKLYREAGLKGHTRRAYVALAIAFALLFFPLTGVRFLRTEAVTPNFFWYLFAGFLWGLSVIVPGMSSSSILMSLGLYQPMTAGIARVDPVVVIPWTVGLVLTALLLSRLVNHLFERYYPEAFHAVCGAVLASLVVIIPLDVTNAGQALLSLMCLAAGFVAAFFMSKMNSGMEAPPTREEKEDESAGAERTEEKKSA